MQNLTCELIAFSHNYNGPAITGCLNSLARQVGAPNFGVTIVELGSDPGHVAVNSEICRKYGCKHIVVEHGGLWSRTLAYNYGIRRSHAKYIGTFDLDLLFDENAIAQACAALDTNPNRVVMHPNGKVQFSTRHLLNLLHGYDERMLLWGDVELDLAMRAQDIGIDPYRLTCDIVHQDHISGKETAIGQKYLAKNKAMCGGLTVKNANGWGDTDTQSITHTNEVPYPEISIVLGTYNRFNEFELAINTARESVNGLKAEFVVVDGGSRDGSQYWCHGQPDITLIEQKKLVGACRAYNAGFTLSRSKYVAHINDDCVVIGDCLARGLEYIKQHDDVGQVLFIHSDDGRVWKTGTIWDGRIMYANFGITKKWLGDMVGWWGDYKKYAGDSQLTLRIRLLGYKCPPMEDCFIRHYRTWDELRQQDPVNNDQQPFYNRWGREDPGVPLPEHPLVFETDTLRLSDNPQYWEYLPVRMEMK